VHTTGEDGAEESCEVFCLVTDLLDIDTYPALDLACAYPMRWECETVIAHHKTDMGHGIAVLRSKDPEGVAPQMWALFAVYQAIHTLIGAAVDAVAIPPEPISFPHALAAATDTITADSPPHDIDLALATFLPKILQPRFFVRDRPDRASPPATKKAGDFPARKDQPSVVNLTRRIQIHCLQRPRPG